jgi:spore coat protein CotH
MKIRRALMFISAAACLAMAHALAQDFPPGFDGPPPFGPDGGRPGGFGGPPGPQPKIKLLKKFDKDGDKFLNADERKAALEYLQNEREAGRLRRGPGGGMRGPGGFGRRDDDEPAKPGKKISPSDVKNYPGAALYDPMVLRTIFIEFDTPSWEKEMAAFKNTDVDMRAKVTVDGKDYSDVGVHFRGMSSFMMVSEGKKRSLDLSFDAKHKDQNLGGYRELELLNSHEDATFLRTLLSYQVEREYLPAPKANFVRVVINGENWGIYVNAQAFNKDFIRDNFNTTKGERWKTPGSPRGQASLKYLGDDPENYKNIYDLKGKDDPKAWADLIKLCKTLNETPPEKLEEALSPILDIDGALRFLALDNALINNDGYWIRTSDYAMYEDAKGVFHIFPRDSNECFVRPEGGPPGGPRGMRFRPAPAQGGGNGDQPPRDRFAGGPGPGPGGPGFGPGGPRLNVKGVELDPLIDAKDDNKPLISKLLAVPKLRERYLGYVRDIAEKWLDWNKLGPIARDYQNLIANDVRDDTRKLDRVEDFLKGLTEDTEGNGRPGPGGRGTIGVKNFADQRREYLLKVTEKN